MNWKRIGRTICALLVICCLLINMSPIKAEATSAVLPALATPVAVPGAMVIGSVLIGLGVLVGVANTDWDNVVSDAVSYFTDQGVIDSDGTIDVWSLTDAGYQYGVSESLVAMIREWLFTEEVVTSNVSSPPTSETVSYNGYDLPNIESFWTDKTNYPYAYMYISGGDYYLQLSSIPVYAEGGYLRYPLNYTWASFYFKSYFTEWYTNTSGTLAEGGTNYAAPIWSSFDIINSDGSLFFEGDPSYLSFANVTTSYDLTLGEVGASDVAIADGYTTWAESATTISGTVTGDDEDQLVYPIGLGQTYEETQQFAQTDVWAGTSTFVDTSTDTEVITGTFADTQVGTFIDSMIDALMTPFEWLANTLLEGIKAIFVPQEDFLTEKVEALRSEFAFADSVISTFELFGGSFLAFSTSPPVIYIDLGATTGSYDFGGKVPFVDLTWYAAYKPTVDVLLSAFMWLVFLWRVGIHLPGIIRGSSGDVPGGIVPSGSEKSLVVKR